MEPHPIPQNVTTFQFHLVGDMTLKQFIYLAVGSAIAYFLFVFLSPIYPIVAWPLIILSAGLGAALAFLPVNSRPLDSWVGAFLKAVYSPTKRVWKKNNQSYKETPLFNSRFITYFAALQPVSSQVPKAAPLLSQPAPVSVPTPMPTPDELKKTVDLAKEAQNLQMKIIQTERTLSHIRQQSQQPTAAPADYSKQVNQALADLQTLVEQASQIKQRIETVGAQEQKIQTPPAPITKPVVKIISPQKHKDTQIALTSFPNVINGIVRDFQGNYMEGVVVVIYDREGLPVRALKTNKLGQFTGSTPLPNGTYKVEMEKEGFTFDVLQIELTGQILSALSVSAKIIQRAQS